MKPLINELTKNLSGCNGCGNGSSESAYDIWQRAKEQGDKMKFQFSVVIEADTYKEATAKVPDEFEILSGGVKSEARSGIQTGGQFAKTTVQPTPQNG